MQYPLNFERRCDETFFDATTFHYNFPCAAALCCVFTILAASLAFDATVAAISPPRDNFYVGPAANWRSEIATASVTWCRARVTLDDGTTFEAHKECHALKLNETS